MTKIEKINKRNEKIVDCSIDIHESYFFEPEKVLRIAIDYSSDFLIKNLEKYRNISQINWSWEVCNSRSLVLQIPKKGEVYIPFSTKKAKSLILFSKKYFDKSSSRLYQPRHVRSLEKFCSSGILTKELEFISKLKGNIKNEINRKNLIDYLINSEISMINCNKNKILNFFIKALKINQDFPINCSGYIPKYKGPIDISLDKTIARTMKECEVVKLPLNWYKEPSSNDQSNRKGYTIPRCDQPLYNVQQFRDSKYD